MSYKYILCDSVLFKVTDDDFIKMCKHVLNNPDKECYLENFGTTMDAICIDSWGPDDCRDFLNKNTNEKFERFNESVN